MSRTPVAVLHHHSFTVLKSFKGYIVHIECPGGETVMMYADDAQQAYRKATQIIRALAGEPAYSEQAYGAKGSYKGEYDHISAAPAITRVTRGTDLLRCDCSAMLGAGSSPTCPVHPLGRQL